MCQIRMFPFSHRFPPGHAETPLRARGTRRKYPLCRLSQSSLGGSPHFVGGLSGALTCFWPRPHFAHSLCRSLRAGERKRLRARERGERGERGERSVGRPQGDQGLAQEEARVPSALA